MQIYTYSEARQNLAGLLEKAKQQGEVCIKRKDGQIFTLHPLKKSSRSPLDVPGVKTDISATEIVMFVQKSRRR